MTWGPDTEVGVPRHAFTMTMHALVAAATACVNDLPIANAEGRSMGDPSMAISIPIETPSELPHAISRIHNALSGWRSLAYVALLPSLAGAHIEVVKGENGQVIRIIGQYRIQFDDWICRLQVDVR